MSLFSATPDFLKWRDKGFSARPLAVAGALGAGSLDLERLQVRQQTRKALLLKSSHSPCKPNSRAAQPHFAVPVQAMGQEMDVSPMLAC